MKLTVVRHGQTIENAQRIVQGHLPGTLSEEGIRQCQILAEKLKNEKFDEVWSSDLLRCSQTAEIVAAYHPNIKINLHPGLRELNFGSLQGKRGDQIDWAAIPGSILRRKMPGGESNLELYERVIKTINEIYKLNKDRNVLVVTHGGPIRIIESAYKKVPLAELFREEQPNTGRWQFDITRQLKSYLKDV